MISITEWKLGLLINGNEKVAKDFKLAEINGNNYMTKIGLIYVSDYGYSASYDYWRTSLYSYQSATSTNWLYLGIDEWTLFLDAYYMGEPFSITVYGNLKYGYWDTIKDIRPVFYLNSSVTYVSGDGTRSTPYRIN